MLIAGMSAFISAHTTPKSQVEEQWIPPTEQHPRKGSASGRVARAALWPALCFWEGSMPVTIEHEAPLELLERFPDLLPNLLREQLGCPIPMGARLRHVSENHNITVAQEFRSDSAVVLEVAPDQPPACAAIVEPQRSIDPD